MSKVARDYLTALFLRVPRFGTICYRGAPDGDRFDLDPEGEWVRYDDVIALIDHLEDVEADEVPKTCATCRHWPHPQFESPLSSVCVKRYCQRIETYTATTFGCISHEVPS